MRFLLLSLILLCNFCVSLGNRHLKDPVAYVGQRRSFPTLYENSDDPSQIEYYYDTGIYNGMPVDHFGYTQSATFNMK